MKLTANVKLSPFTPGALRGFAKFSDGREFEFFEDKIKGTLRFRTEREQRGIIESGPVRISFASAKRERAIRASLTAGKPSDG